MSRGRRGHHAPTDSPRCRCPSRNITDLLPLGQRASQRHHHDHLRVTEVLARDDERRRRIPLRRTHERTARVSVPGPPRTHPTPKQMATKMTADTMPNDPRMLSMLPKCPAVVSTTTKNHADARDWRDQCADASGAWRMPSSQREAQREDERSGDAAWIHGHALEQQRQHDRHVSDRDHHEHDHQAHGKRHIRLCEIGKLEKKRSAAREANQQQPYPERFLEPSSLASPIAAAGASTKFASSESTTSRPFRSGSRICCTVRPRPT